MGVSKVMFGKDNMIHGCNFSWSKILIMTVIAFTLFLQFMLFLQVYMHHADIKQSRYEKESFIGRFSELSKEEKYQHLNSATNASTFEFAWKTVSWSISIFSSYYDKRQLKKMISSVHNRSVVIFGNERSNTQEETVHCLFIMDDNRRVMEHTPAIRIILAKRWKKAFYAMMYRCNISSKGTPRYVTLLDVVSIKNTHSIPLSAFTSVIDSSSAMLHQFGVCYESPLHGKKYDQEIMDSIEINQFLGATWFTIYVYEAHDKAIKILKYYSEKLKIVDVIWNWGDNMPRPVYYKNELVGVHDCVYRNMFRVRYLVLCDLDEIIMPENGLNWYEMMRGLDFNNRAYFTFQHLAFHKNTSKPEYLSCPDDSKLKFKMPSFFASHNRSKSVLTRNKQVKSIIKPPYSITVYVHRSRWMMEGYVPYYVPTETAVMKHFRDKDDSRFRVYDSVFDTSMDKLKPLILRAIEKHFCRNIKGTVG